VLGLHRRPRSATLATFKFVTDTKIERFQRLSDHMSELHIEMLRSSSQTILIRAELPPTVRGTPNRVWLEVVRHIPKCISIGRGTIDVIQLIKSMNGKELDDELKYERV
jgi:hypothetical protein